MTSVHRVPDADLRALCNFCEAHPGDGEQFLTWLAEQALVEEDDGAFVFEWQSLTSKNDWPLYALQALRRARLVEYDEPPGEGFPHNNRYRVMIDPDAIAVAINC